MINFTSEDRYAMSEKKKYRFSTPVHAYKKWGDMQIVADADAVWHFPDGEFTYGRFRLTDYESNPTNFR
ncbi:MAG: hypothetical protein IPN29_15255 [Saprospiraceae bacterium]|nr:hypothetical protein [Saprospiraceae bacterium]